ncbi:DUF3592 domain-containing protein [Mucilaginibacter sp. AW1-3]
MIAQLPTNVTDMQHLQIVLLSAFLILIAIIIIRRYLKRKHLRQVGIETEGVVVEIITDVSSNNNSVSNFPRITYTPVVKYLAEKDEIIKKYDTGHNPSRYHVGDKVRVLYDPADTSSYIIK